MNENDKYKNYKKKLFCCNCGKYGHKYSKCNEPIISLGVIAIKPDNNETYEKLKDFFKQDKFYNLVKSNTMNNNILLEIKKYENRFKFLMIQRRKTLGYIEFLRGRYDENNITEISNLFEQMVPMEIDDISNKEFMILWHDLWKNNVDNKYYKSELDESLKKFNILKDNTNFKKMVNEIKLNYETPEWGFPKGRRIYLEKNINCAVREFEEETSLTSDDYILINNIPPIQETFYGTNDILYRHIYYFALCKSNLDVNLNENNPNQMVEIGDIGFFSFKDASNLVRSYHTERLNILNESFIFMSSIVNSNFKINEDISFNTNDLYDESLNILDNEDIDENIIYNDSEELEHFQFDP